MDKKQKALSDKAEKLINKLMQPSVILGERKFLFNSFIHWCIANNHSYQDISKHVNSGYLSAYEEFKF